MRFKTPWFGPNAGRLTLDGEPAPELSDDQIRRLVALPDGPTSGNDAPRSRGRDGAARAHFEELQRAGVTVTFSECQERVSRALERTNNKRNR